MERLIRIIIELILIISFGGKLVYTENRIVHGCHIDDSNIATCTLIPQCNDNSNVFLKQVKKFVFYNQLTRIESHAFTSCLFNNPSVEVDLIFNSLTEIQDFAFQNMNINAKVNLIINGDDHRKQLSIRQNAFKLLYVNKNAKFYIEVSNYDEVKVEAALVEDLVQDENSNVNFIFKGNNYVSFLTKTQIDLNPPKLTKNVTFKLEVFNCKRVYIDESKFQFVSIDALSEFSMIISSTKEVYLAKNAFNSLTVSFKAKFSLFINKANTVVLGEGLFENLIQEDYSLFFVLIEDIKTAKEESTETADEDDDDDYEEASCFYVPVNFLKNIKQNRKALLQVHFINFETHFITISQRAIHEVFMNDDSKIQIYFKDIDEDIIFEEEAINHVQTTNGVFEIWVENHATGVSTENSIIQTRIPVNFVLNPNAISSIYLTPRSQFRIAFHNSKSMFNYYETCANQVFRDDLVDDKFKDIGDYRTKIRLEIKNSPNFHMNFDNNFLKAKIPKVIEIGDYMPLLSILKDDDTFDMSQTLGSFKYNEKYTGDDLYQYELCQYSTTRSYLDKYLIFFSDASKLTEKKTNVLCSSCLFLYLYRYVHRRQDFFYVKDNLPECFKNLFYKDTFAFNEAAYSAIDDKINMYWTLQRCDLITGMRSMNDSKSERLIEKHICSKYFQDSFDNANEVNKTATCYKNNFEYIKNNISMKSMDASSTGRSASSILALLFVVAVAIACLIVIVNAMIKKKYCAKPCIHVNIGGRKNLKLFSKLKTAADDDNDDEHDRLDDDYLNAEYRNETNESRESIQLCKVKEKNTIKKFIKRQIKKSNNYQSMGGKYQTLDQVVVNDDVSVKRNKRSVNVLYDVNKNKTTLDASCSNNNNDEDAIFDEAIRLKTNPIEDLENSKKSKPVDV